MPRARDAKVNVPVESVRAPSSVCSRKTPAPETGWPSGFRTRPLKVRVSCAAREGTVVNRSMQAARTLLDGLVRKFI